MSPGLEIENLAAWCYEIVEAELPSSDWTKTIKAYVTKFIYSAVMRLNSKFNQKMEIFDKAWTQFLV